MRFTGLALILPPWRPRSTRRNQYTNSISRGGPLFGERLINTKQSANITEEILRRLSGAHSIQCTSQKKEELTIFSNCKLFDDMC
jgi:hypothetical protein